MLTHHSTLRHGPQPLFSDIQALRSTVSEIFFPNPVQARVALDAAASQEMEALFAETDSGLFSEKLLELGRRWQERGRWDWASRAYAAVRALAAKGLAPESSRSRAERAANTLSGQGASGDRFEILLPGILRQALEPRSIFPMLAGTLVSDLVRGFALSRLMAVEGAAWYTRGLGVRALSGLAAFTAEVPTFALVGHALSGLGSKTGASSGIPAELAETAIGLGLLKIFQGLGDKAQAWLPGGGFSREAIWRVASFSSLLAARRAEEALRLRPRLDGESLGADVLASMLGMEFGSRLARFALGPAYSLRMRTEMSRSQEMPLLVSRHDHSLSRPWLAPVFMAMSAESVGGLGALGGSASGIRPADATKLSKTEIYIQDLIVRINNLDEQALQELYRVPLSEFGNRALAGDLRAITTLEELHDFGHREAVHYLAQAVPKWALREVEFARRGEPFHMERVKSMRLAALEDVVRQSSDPSYMDCVSALFDLHRMGHPDAEGAIRHAFEWNIDSAVRLLKLAKDPNFFGGETARKISWRSSLVVLVEAAKEEANLKVSSKALSALVGLLEDSPPHPLATLSLAEVAKSKGAELFRHLDKNAPAREAFFYLVQSGDLGARVALRLAIQHSPSAWNIFQKRTGQIYDVEGMPPTPELSDLIDAARIWESPQSNVERQSFPAASTWTLEESRFYQLGRDPAGKHPIAIPDRRVSRRHLVLIRQGAGLILVDSAVKYVDQPASYGVWIQNPNHSALWERAVPGYPYTLLPGRSFAIGMANANVGVKETIVFSWDGVGALQTQDSLLNISRAPGVDEAPTTARSPGTVSSR